MPHDLPNEIPIQPVERPVICPPYSAPTHHWLYDTKTGLARKEPDRRPASYWYRTKKTGSAQASLFAEEERDDLPLVNLLREDVKRWREADYRGASNVTRELCAIGRAKTAPALVLLPARGRRDRHLPGGNALLRPHPSPSVQAEAVG